MLRSSGLRIGLFGLVLSMLGLRFLSGLILRTDEIFSGLPSKGCGGLRATASPRFAWGPLALRPSRTNGRVVSLTFGIDIVLLWGVIRCS
jgi:hypothetical protein